MQFTKIEINLRKKGYELIAGMDEAGRGPLAGPVVAAIVILPESFYSKDLQDSKKLSDKKRRILYDLIVKSSIDYGIGVVDAKEIDKINILNATKKAMQLALNSLKIKPDYILIDAVKISTNYPTLNLIKGEDKSANIAAASIIAKVYRDNLMLKYHEIYPDYAFNKHKGYGTFEHQMLIAKYGPCDIHRKSFEPLKSNLFSYEYYCILKELKKIKNIEKLKNILDKIQKTPLTKKESELLYSHYFKIKKRCKK